MLSFLCLLCFSLSLSLQPLPQPTLVIEPPPRSALTGVYRIDIAASDRLYSVVAGASSSLPFGEQQRFFIDLAVRLTPPDLLAIERQGTRIDLGSSRAPRMTLVADGLLHNTRAADGHVIHLRLSLENAGGNERLIFTSSGRTEDNFSVQFESIDSGRRLRVVRRIAAAGLDQPVTIRTIYNKISDVARWEIYGEAQVATASKTEDVVPPAEASAGSESTSDTAPMPKSGASGPTAAHNLRSALGAWIAATNGRAINEQMAFYAPRLVRFYLKSDVTRDFVREEKERAFASASVIEIRAEEPEIIFQNDGDVAVMRYRKKYRIENGRQSRRGEVIQELRWRRVADAWRIFYERDIRVLR